MSELFNERMVEQQDGVCGWSNQWDWAKYGYPRLLSMNRGYGWYLIMPMSSDSFGPVGQSQNFKHLAVASDQHFGKLRRETSCSALYFCSVLVTHRTACAALERLAKTLT